jgi:glycosyltransferase involved in cell wall biosynthesis
VRRPLVSVVVANYNNYKFLYKSLKSVIYQTYCNIQLVIVDDGSTDLSKKIIRSFIDCHNKTHCIDFLDINVNEGSSIAKKKGIELVKGEFCCFLDSDDYLSENAIERLMNEMFMNQHLSLVYSNAYCIDSSGNVNGLLNYSRSGSDMLNDRVCFHLALWRMDFYNKLNEGLSIIYNIAHDIDLFMKLEEVGSVKYVDNPLYYYRKHDNNISIGFEKLGFSYAERIIARYEAQKRRGTIDLKQLGEELQGVFVKYKRKSEKISFKKYIHTRLKRMLFK